MTREVAAPGIRAQERKLIYGNLFCRKNLDDIPDGEDYPESSVAGNGREPRERLMTRLSP